MARGWGCIVLQTLKDSDWYCSVVPFWCGLHTLRPRQNAHHFADNIFKCIFLNKNAWISLEISLKFVPKVQINNIPALVQIMAWRQPGDKPLSEPMMVSLLTHICVTRPQWVNFQLISQSSPTSRRYAVHSGYVFSQREEVSLCSTFSH